VPRHHEEIIMVKDNDKPSLTGRAAKAAGRAALRGAKNALGPKVIATQSGPPPGKCYCGKKAKSAYAGTCGKSACLKKAGSKMDGMDDD
jgi:hypothetical protein